MTDTGDGKNVGVVQPLGAWAVKVTVPLKASIGFKVIVEVPDVPAIRYRVDGEVDTLKLGLSTWTVIVTEWLIPALSPVTVSVYFPEFTCGTEMVSAVLLLLL